MSRRSERVGKPRYADIPIDWHKRWRPDLQAQVRIFLACGFCLEELVIELSVYVRRTATNGGMQGEVTPRIFTKGQS